MKPELSQALDSLTEELRASDFNTMRAAASRPRQHAPTITPHSLQLRPNQRQQRPARSLKSCPICKQVGRSDSSHFLSECPHLPEQDRRFILKARQIANIFDNNPDEESNVVYADDVDDTSHDTDTPIAYRVLTRQSPYFLWPPHYSYHHRYWCHGNHAKCSCC